MPGPVAIGAVGGSGTRIIAQFVRDNGIFVGADLNQPNDNLWFTMLFARRSVLVDPPTQFARLAELFFKRMAGEMPTPSEVDLLTAIAAQQRYTRKTNWLNDRMSTFLQDPIDPIDDGVAGWGWKAPNTHIVIEKLMRLNDQLRYVHVVRHGLDMAFSANQNQLTLWGEIFLNRPIDITPRDSLSYWCAVHRRMAAIKEEFGQRVMFLDFDRLCAAPEETSRKLASFVGLDPHPNLIADFVAKVSPPASLGRYRQEPLSQFLADDLQFLEDWGYPAT